MQQQADGDPGDKQLQQRAGLDQQQNCGKRRGHPPGKRSLPRLAIQKGSGITQHDPADERDKQKHDEADEVEPRRECEEAVANGRARAGTLQGEQDAGPDDNDNRAEG